jgi:hypothetical protein
MGLRDLGGGNEMNGRPKYPDINENEPDTDKDAEEI